MAEFYLHTPLTEEDLLPLTSGDLVYLNGTVYSGRDTAHRRMLDLLLAGKELPLSLAGQIIYYMGPAPAKPGRPIGSAGPTTSSRMDSFTPVLIAQEGLKGMIGKGPRSEEVKRAMIKYKAVYFGATGGAAALLAKHIKSAEIIAYPELGPEAIRRLTVENFPVVVINDLYGGDLYLEGRSEYTKS